MAKYYQSHKIEKHYEKILLNMAEKKAKGMTTYIARLLVSKLRGEIGAKVYGRSGKNTRYRTGDFLRSAKRTKTIRDGSNFYARIFFDSDELSVGGNYSGLNNHISKYGSEKWGYNKWEKVKAVDLAMWLDQGYRVQLRRSVLERAPAFFMKPTIKAKDKLISQLRADAVSDKMYSNLMRGDVGLPSNFGGSSYNAFYKITGDDDTGDDVGVYDEEDESDYDY